MTEDEMVGWHHQLDGHEFELTPGDGEGQGYLVCCSPWYCKEPDMILRLNNNNIFSGGRNLLLGLWNLIFIAYLNHIKYVSFIFRTAYLKCKYIYIYDCTYRTMVIIGK